MSLRKLCVTLGGNEILRDVDADLMRGRITALIGLNGAGKTTLLRALIREVPYTGEVRFLCGHDHSKPTPEHIGYVPQKLLIEANLPLTVLDLFGLSLRKKPLFFGTGEAFRQRAEGLLANVGAAHLLDRQVEKLSGGQLQRVLLALSLEPQPELLLLDEPAAGIDFQMKQSFYQLIRDLNQRTGITIVLVSHDVSVVAKMAHRVLCLKDNRIECEGPPEEIITPEVLARVFGGEMTVFHHHHS